MHIHLMIWIGYVMMLIFLHVFFAPFRRLKQAVAAEDWPAGGKSLAQIRMLVGVNILIGLVVIAIASGKGGVGKSTVAANVALALGLAVSCRSPAPILAQSSRMVARRSMMISRLLLEVM